MDNNFNNNQPLNQPIQQPMPATPNQIPQNQTINQVVQNPIMTDQLTPHQPSEVQNAQQFKNPSKFSIKNTIASISGVVGVIGFFLPWFTALKNSANMTDIGDDYRYLGYFALILLVATSTIALTNISQKLNSLYKIIITTLSGISVLLTVIEMIIVLNETNGLVSVGIGLYLTIIGSLATAIISWIPIKE